MYVNFLLASDSDIIYMGSPSKFFVKSDSEELVFIFKGDFSSVQFDRENVGLCPSREENADGLFFGYGKTPCRN